MTLDPRRISWPPLRALRGFFVPVRRWSAGDVALSPAERYRRETELEEAIRGLPAELRTVFELSNIVIRALHYELGDELPIIGVGGIMSGADAKAKMDAGASLVQLYSGLIYAGPALVRECARAIKQ